MKNSEVIKAVQVALMVPPALQSPHVGPLTRGALERLANADPEAEYNYSVMLPPVEPVAALLPGFSQQHLSDSGAAFIQSFEGLNLTAYQDGGGVWTIGWGHTGLQHMDGTVYKGRTITHEEAEQLFWYDMQQFQARVRTLVKVRLTQDEFDALVSFDFNTGGLTFPGATPSSVLRDLNSGYYLQAADNLLAWNHDNGKIVRGLTRRRQSERRLFLSLKPAIVEA